jgi:hypothetical protein
MNYHDNYKDCNMYNEFDHRMVVNEFESLQASYEMQGSSTSIQAYDR